MTKTAAIGPANGNPLQVGNSNSLRKSKSQTKGDSFDFPNLVSQQDTKLTLAKNANKKPSHTEIPAGESVDIPQLETAQHSEDFKLSIEKDVEGQEVEGVKPPEPDKQDPALVLRPKLEPQTDLAALWLHLNGGKETPEVPENQVAQNPLKLDLPNLMPGKTQISVRDIEVGSGALKKAADTVPEHANIRLIPKLSKDLEPDITVAAESSEELQAEKIPVKVLNVETHFSFSNAPSLGLQLGGAITENLHGEVQKLQAVTSKLTLDPNADLVKSLHIQLIPESLGELKVLMHLRGSELTMKIEVSSNLAAKKLAEDKDLLKDLLEQAGFEMTGDPVLIVIRNDQSANSDAKMNDQSQNRQPTSDGSTLSYGKNFGDGNERQQKHEQLRNSENSTAQRSQDLVEAVPGRRDRVVESNSSSGLYL